MLIAAGRAETAPFAMTWNRTTTGQYTVLVLPLFVKEGIAEAQPVALMPGVVQHTRESVRKAAAEAVAAGVGGRILFGIPAGEDGWGSSGGDPGGILQLALRPQ